ncbi:hypothetical protein M409DRAFT_29815 [Zasmidium cellare ATCC 36951]|uniref:Uncharacterized protein n=1 Tax=Zasmidium cellare ATCC 36951 TaxID=1080233 RepID=A0A6A6BXX2_ZASCE|nr:uncharacterized protein M409DRAFT_29815 [Zasmidium cellare ATCC 36951]KAF2159647.1 hypothetical protein M409DRAFT_29815 [Zasmidium cellare ATCC 36951]
MSLNIQEDDISQPAQNARMQDADQENNQAPTFSFTSREKTVSEMQDPGDVQHENATKPTDPTYVFTNRGLVLTITCTSLISLLFGLIIGLYHDDLGDTMFNITLIVLVVLVLCSLDHYIYQHPSYQQATGYDKLAGRLSRFAPYLCCLAAIPFDPRFASMLVNVTLIKLVLQSARPWVGTNMETHTELAPAEDLIEHLESKCLWALRAFAALTVYNVFGYQFVEDAFLAVFGETA